MGFEGLIPRQLAAGWFIPGKIAAAKLRIEEAYAANDRLEETCYWSGMPPSIYSEHLAWHMKGSWDFSAKGLNIETFTEKTRVMEKEKGKTWMIEEELKPLQEYLDKLTIELDKRG